MHRVVFNISVSLISEETLTKYAITGISYGVFAKKQSLLLFNEVTRGLLGAPILCKHVRFNEIN